ncbi:MAG TPA: hypothetical protein VGQ09_08735 [Chitinophagaceae bacterium]|jgi:hypothetical protein|nr:hypothetical protein [Chitinophagaceae bacterium]
MEDRETIEAMVSIAAYDIRGRILQRAVEIESTLDIYISEHFTTDSVKNEELVCLVLSPRVTFENKIQIFRYLVDKYNPEFKNEYKQYFKDLVQLCEERNIFAHYPVDFSEQSIINFRDHKVVTFVKLKNVTQEGDIKLVNVRAMPEDAVNTILGQMIKYIQALKKLIGNSPKYGENQNNQD